MTSISEFHPALSTRTPSLPADFTVVSLWSLLGLSFSVTVVMANLAAFPQIAW